MEGGEPEGRVLGKLEKLAKAVSSRTDYTVLVGHSQGAEISRRVAVTTDVDACVFVGSGESPLSMLRILNASPFLAAVMLAVLIPYPLIFVLAFDAIWQSSAAFAIFLWNQFLVLTAEVLAPSNTGPAISSDAFDPLWQSIWQVVWAVSVVIAWLIIAGLTVRAASKRPKDLETTPDAEVMHVKSPIDPVSFGSISGAPLRRYVPVAARANQLKAIGTEHVSYFSKWQTGAFILEAIYGTSSMDLSAYHRPRPFPLWAWIVAALAALGLTAFLYWLGTVETELIRAGIGPFIGSG
ncbi:hypothetical protein ACWG8W_10695 [Citricoccus zhacaiensis]